MRCAFVLWGCLTVAWSAHAAGAPSSIWDKQGGHLVGFLPDNTTLMTVHDSRADVWDAHSLLRKPDLDHCPSLSFPRLSPDGRWLTGVVADSNSRASPAHTCVLVWDLTGKSKPMTFDHGNEEVRNTAVSPDGRLLAVGTSSSVVVWDTQACKRVHTLQQEPQPDEALRLAFSPDGKTLAVAGQSAELWDTTSGKHRRTLHGQRGHIEVMAFTPDGSTLLGGGGFPGLPGELVQWDSTGALMARWRQGHGCPITELKLSADGKTLVTVSEEDDRIAVWSWPKATIRRQFERIGDVVAVGLSADGRRLAAMLGYEGFCLWDLDTGRQLLSPPREAERARREVLLRQQRRRQATARSQRPADSAEKLRRAEYALAIQQAQRAVAEWNFDRARELLEGLRPKRGNADLRNFEWYYLHNQLPRTHILAESWELPDQIRAAVRRDGKSVALVRADGNVSLHDVATNKERAVLATANSRVVLLDFSPVGDILATVEEAPRTHEFSFRLWDVRTGQLLSRQMQGKQPVRAVAFSSDGQQLALTSGNGDIVIWDVRKRERLRTLSVREEVYALAFSPDGRLLAVGCKAGYRLWDSANGKQLSGSSRQACGTQRIRVEVVREVLGKDGRCRKQVQYDEREVEVDHDRPALVVAFVPDGNSVITADQSEARLWDIATGRLVRSWYQSASDLSVTTDGEFVVDNTGLVNLHTGKRATSYSPDTDSQLIPLLYERLRACRATTGNTVLSVTADARKVQVREIDLQPARHVLVDKPIEWPCLTFSEDGEELLAVGNEHVVRWKVQAGNLAVDSQKDDDTDWAELHFGARATYVHVNDVKVPLSEFAKAGGNVHFGNGRDAHRVLALSPDGRLLATEQEDRVTLRDVASGKPVSVLPAFGECVHIFSDQVRFSNDGNTLLTWVDDVVSWDVKTGQERSRIIPPGKVLALHLGADGVSPEVMVILPDGASSPQLWSAATGERIAVLSGLRTPQPCVAFSSDGTRLATGGDDGEVQLWDAHTGHPLLVLPGSDDAARVCSLAFRSDGKALAAGTDMAVLLWLANRPPRRP